MKINFRKFYEGDTGTPAGGAPAPTPAPTPAPAPAPAPVASDWTSTLDADAKGYIQNKGFQDPKMLLDSYKGLEKLIGVKERVILKPEKEDDAAAWNDFYNKAGRPEKATDYQLGLPTEGTDKAFADWAHENFHKAGLNKSQAANLAKAYMEFSGNLQAQQQQAHTETITQAESVLKGEWGAAFEQNKNVANKAVQGLGIDQATLAKLEGAMGPAATAKLFHTIGSKMGEDTFVSGSRGGGILTPEAAANKISELRNDSNFVARFSKGDSDAIKELNDLHKWAYPSA